MGWGHSELIEHLKRLLTPNLIGTYRSFEITEIVGFYKKGPPTNFFSLLVAEPGPPVALPVHPFINDARIRLPSTSWTFGVTRFRVSLSHVIGALECHDKTGEWRLTSTPLKVGNLVPVPPQFVPADAYQPHPWNGLLKNNFFEGSHVLELFDIEKAEHRFLISEPTLLSKLAEMVREIVPIGIDGLSDRVGNVLIQLPVTVAVARFGRDEGGCFSIEPTWHPDAPARPLRLSWENYDDATIEDYTATAVEGGPARIPGYSKRTGARYILWDDENGIIMGASAQSAFIGSGPFHVSSYTIDPKTREFLKPSSDGTLEPFSIVLRDAPPRLPSSASMNSRQQWRSERVFRDSLHALRERKEFVQYRGKNGAGRSEALADVQWLMDTHGRDGVWLWDPYLDAGDVLNTLFLCTWPGADLRALSDSKTPPPCKHCGRAQDESICPLSNGCGGDAGATKRQPWKDVQRNALEMSKGNGQGLMLEFRVREGNAGWPFHDRFLIFPSSTGGAMAWSLGTSINSLGKQHHILQKVSDGELIREAFLELWDSLSDAKYLVWKTS